jgi:predicted enzyme related to lactoylglutathione lyase
MNATDPKIKSLIEIINTHEFSKLGDVLANDCQWKTLDGKGYSGVSSILEMWNARCGIFPDFQLAVEKMVGLESVYYVHLRFMGSAGTNKSLDMSFSTAVILEMEWSESVLIRCHEFGDASKLTELELIMRTVDPQKATVVSGFGGVFFKAKDPKAMAGWYDEHLGTRFGSNSWSTFKWRERENRTKIGRTEFSLFKVDSDYFAPSEAGFMLNFRVHNLEGLLQKLRDKDIKIVGNTQVFEYGKFAWIIDPEGNKIELWEPIDAALEAHDAG